MTIWLYSIIYKRFHWLSKQVKNFASNERLFRANTRQCVKRHEMTHTGEKPHPCSYCPLRFRERQHLQNHERLHTGELPYICEHCGRGFAKSSTLTDHIRTHTREVRKTTKEVFFSWEYPLCFNTCGTCRKCYDEHWISVCLYMYVCCRHLGERRHEGWAQSRSFVWYYACLILTPFLFFVFFFI